MGGPVLGPHFDSVLCQARHVPEAWHAPFCGAAIILKMRTCRRWRSTAFIWPRPARGGVIGRRARGRGKSSFLWKSSIPEDNARLRLPLPVFFPFSHYPPYVPTRRKQHREQFIAQIFVPKAGVNHIDKLPRSLVDDSHWGFGALPPLMLSVDASL
jgi:hypothetical protein